MKQKLLLAFFTLCLVGCATTSQQDIEINNSTDVKTAGLSNVKINTMMDERDKAKLRQLVANATMHQHVTWQSEKNSNKYEFTSANIFVSKKGQPCREYKITAFKSEFLAHVQIPVQATACRQEDSSWQLISSSSDSR